jgi:dephospho-CoA kinase
MITVGLTGSIASGKSTAASMLRAMGLPVFDADAAVHELYADPGFAARLERDFPGISTPQGVDRARLANLVSQNPARLAALEKVVHPEVSRLRGAFLDRKRGDGTPIAILDIPLLFETGAERICDAVILIVADDTLRRTRAFERRAMTGDKWQTITARQWPQDKKKALATIVVDNSGTRDHLHDQLAKAISALRSKPHA